MLDFLFDGGLLFRLRTLVGVIVRRVHNVFLRTMDFTLDSGRYIVQLGFDSRFPLLRFGRVCAFRIYFFLDHTRGRESFGERSEVCGEEHAVRPARFLAPQAAEMIANSLICCFCQAAVLTFTKLVVSLGDLPN